jgi:hypothetical protein
MDGRDLVGGAWESAEMVTFLRIVKQNSSVKFKTVGEFGKLFRKALPMRSGPDCCELYANLLRLESVSDNRFTVRGDNMPLLLELREGVDEIVFSMKEDPGAVSNGPADVALQPNEEKRQERVSRRCGACKKLLCKCSDISTNNVEPDLGSKYRPKKKSKKSGSKGKKLDSKQIFTDSHVPRFSGAPAPEPDDVVREKALEGDEVVFYCATGSEVGSCLMEINVCRSCGSFEEQKDMLACSNCCNFYHWFCLGLKAPPLGYESGLWKCGSCKTCEKCDSASHENMILVCEKCDEGYHSFCLDPPLDFIPVGEWLCPKHAHCISCDTKTAGTNPHHTWHDNDTLCHVCWLRIRDESQCPTCLKAYDPDEWECSFMVGCDCGRWVHRGCDGLTHEIYDELNKPEHENSKYNCIVCRQEGKVQFENAQLMEMLEESKKRLEEAAAAAALPAPAPIDDATPRGGEAEAKLPMKLEDNQDEMKKEEPGNEEEQLVVVEDVIPEKFLALIVCAFCHRSVQKNLGRLVPVSRSQECWVHTDCTLWGSNVTLTKAGGVGSVEEAIERASRGICTICGIAGASIGCRAKGCSVMYHLPCALENNVNLHRVGFLCLDHMDPRRAPALVISFRNKRFVTLQTNTTKRQLTDRTTVEQTWDDRLKSIIAKNPSAFLNRAFDETEMSSERQERDNSFKKLAEAVSNGSVMKRGALQIQSFGTVVTRGTFHTSMYLFNLGFKAVRRFWSYVNKGEIGLYTFVIEQSEENTPVFVISASDDPLNPVRSSAPDVAWKLIQERFEDKARGVGDKSWREEMFGFVPWVMSAMEGFFFFFFFFFFFCFFFSFFSHGWCECLCRLQFQVLAKTICQCPRRAS